MAVTYSGKKFPVVEIIDTKSLKIIKRFEFDGKVLHLRWSKEKPHLYVSVNDTNKVVILNTKDWSKIKEIKDIQKPSGIFIYEGKK
jgi:protein NirF